MIQIFDEEQDIYIVSDCLFTKYFFLPTKYLLITKGKSKFTLEKPVLHYFK